jgi:hypothetical protein
MLSIFLLKIEICANLKVNKNNSFYKGEHAMKNPLESVTGTIISGVILTVVLVFFLKNFLVAGV